MNSELTAVRQRRAELVARIALQREQMAGIGVRFQTPLALADQGMATARFLRSHPVLVAGVIAVLVIRRRGVAGVARIGLRVWNVYSYFTALKAGISR